MKSFDSKYLHTRSRNYKNSISTMLFATFATLSFQNCDKPYEVTTIDVGASDERSEIEREKEGEMEGQTDSSFKVELLSDRVVNGKHYVTHPELGFLVDLKDIDKMIISESPDCLGEWAPYMPSLMLPFDMPNGPTTLYLKFLSFDDKETECIEKKFVYDDSPPKVSFIEKPGNRSETETPLIRVRGIDDGGDIGKIEISVDGGSWQTIQAVPGKSTMEFRLNRLSRGYHSLDVRAYDIAGHVSDYISHSWYVYSRRR